MTNQWIKTSERLPDADQVVDIVVDGERVPDAVFLSAGFFMDEFDAMYELKEVTHWRVIDLPEAQPTSQGE